METLHAWQPITSMKGRNLADLGFFEVIPHFEYLKIKFDDVKGNKFEVIYDQTISPVEYYVWSYRFSTEYGRFDLISKQIDLSGVVDEDSLYFYKVSNSEYIKWFDQNPLINSHTNPKLEHHLYMNDSQVFEVLSDYEPKFLKIT
ncbi:hypothetical protein KP77_04350 [Jeotgalibacillus alimentarius]|uniref:Uncharacterized protein n=1 Tax=Jeotgalibacillus alimentarius TaxID=135826 RepID=A0A0C2SHL9_9BACL|nr:hypothetical protein [Jeotgalibacillus alimentarius]KIL53459.1 hypothetical protein KP77_04350 [Jeotgalibacillus alimentarius]